MQQIILSCSQNMHEICHIKNTKQRINKLKIRSNYIFVITIYINCDIGHLAFTCVNNINIILNVTLIILIKSRHETFYCTVCSRLCK